MYEDIRLPFDGRDGAAAVLHHAAEPADNCTYTAPIGQLVGEMDALTMDEDELVDPIPSDMPPRPATYVDIIGTNLGQQAVDDEEAFTLELGPNNCAASQRSLAGDRRCR
jgi:hypothetical protein